MHNVLTIRHSISAYPADALSEEGVKLAQSRRGEFRGFGVAIASERVRAQNTIKALGYNVGGVWPIFNELELDDVNAPSAHDYVFESFVAYPELVAATADRLIDGLRQTKKLKEPKVLVVTHNLALSSLLFKLTGHIESFKYLSGMLLSVSEGDVQLINRS